jgi:cob(I)alamin adenosyltransferase
MMKVYTRKGDDGTTRLFHGGRVRKDAPRPEAYGAIDEAQAFIGVARSQVPRGGDLDRWLIGVERDLWVVMAELATADDGRAELVGGESLVTAEMVAALEEVIDEVSAWFEAPTYFVLPGEDSVAAALDVARTVVRRAERAALSVAAEGSQVVPYLNRLSDLLWTFARWHEGESRPTRSVEGGR